MPSHLEQTILTPDMLRRRVAALPRLSLAHLPTPLEDLPRLADEATREGRLTTPLSYLLSIGAVGLEECHYPRAPARAPPEGPG